MGMYTGLRFKGVVKPGFRKGFTDIAMDSLWEESEDEKLRSFSTVDRYNFIPTGSLCYMPDEWEDENGMDTDGFERDYNEETGYWSFQCSLKNYNTIEEFLKLVPYFCESVEHAEVFYEENIYSKRYELVNGEMLMTNENFIKYGWDDRFQ